MHARIQRKINTTNVEWHKRIARKITFSISGEEEMKGKKINKDEGDETKKKKRREVKKSTKTREKEEHHRRTNVR